MAQETTFGQDFYDGIWGSVHRHDYCPDLARGLVAKHGRCRILDIGTGCGYLVTCLRELGCEAWGLEVSDYALANCCAPGLVRRGDIRNIPFAAGQFDVVHSQGVWGYFPEEDIRAAWAECQRVGRVQDHNIDYDDADPDHRYLVIRSREWWKNQFHPKVLVACPIHVSKEYSFERWIENVKAFTYPNFDVLVVDHSPTPEAMVAKYGSRVPMIWDEETARDQVHEALGITGAMATIRRHFLSGNYERWMNVESDVIPPLDVIERLLALGGETDWISHAYPGRGSTELAGTQQGIGCSLLSRRLIQQFDFAHAGDNSPDGWLWGQVKPDPGMMTMELWNYFPTKHLGA